MSSEHIPLLFLRSDLLPSILELLASLPNLSSQLVLLTFPWLFTPSSFLRDTDYDISLTQQQNVELTGVCVMHGLVDMIYFRNQSYGE